MSTEDRIADLVKNAMKEALEKRAGVEAMESMVKEEVPEVAPEPVKEIVLEKNQQKFSKLLGKRSHKNDFAVTVFKDEDWNEEVRCFIPKVKEDYYLVPEHAEAILRAWELNEKVLIHGPTGAGKSSIVEQLCAITRRPFIRVNCTGDMDSSMVFGQLMVKDASTVWADGPVTEAVRHGAVFAWDEWDVTPPEISMGLQWLLEEDSKLFLKEMPGAAVDKFIEPHKNFRLVALGNTQGQGDDTGSHAGTNVQNTATLDRFGTTIRIGYLPEKIEIGMLTAKVGKGLEEKVIGNLVKLAGLVRQGYQQGQLSLTLSPRSLISICRKMQYNLSLEDSLDLVYANKLTSMQQKVVYELRRKVFGK